MLRGARADQRGPGEDITIRDLEEFEPKPRRRPDRDQLGVQDLQLTDRSYRRWAEASINRLTKVARQQRRGRSLRRCPRVVCGGS
jgi:hypothetical protein